MKEIQYIMVTNWSLHWDKLKNKWGNSTLFTQRVIKDGLSKGPWPMEATTLFIKLDESNTYENSWIGKSKNFRNEIYKDKPSVRFDVSDLQICECPVEFRKYTNGWHLNKSDALVSVSSKGKHSANEHLQPAFFKEMATCDAMTFELHCFHLLRLLGIHDIHKFPQEDNRGKADGFFRFHSLAVIYDATLETDYQKKKETQIENYVNQLKKEKIEFNSNSYGIKDMQRQVWIITRGSQSKLLKTEDHIKVKEIPFTKLIEVYHQRLTNEIELDELWDILKA